MTIIKSLINTDSEEFKINAAALSETINHFQQLEKKVIDNAQANAKRYHDKNLLLPRERLALLLDPGQPFLELMSLAGYQMHDDKEGESAGGGLISGIGFVNRVKCLIIINNYALRGGTISPSGLNKSLRLQQIALENKLPIITLAQSGGANLMYAAEVFIEGARTFANQARLSAAGIPHITIVHGSATAGGAYQPGLSDYVIMVKDQATMYLAGPPLLKAATGEIATDEEIGGAEMHCSIAGSAEYLAEDDQHGISIARDIIKRLNWPTKLNNNLQSKPPRYAANELLGVIPADNKTPYDVREVLARIIDDSDFLDFKIAYDQQTICGHGSIMGFNCGFIGNNGPITAQGAAKAASFIQLCEQTNVPIIFLHNTTGFMVGVESERQGVIKHGSKMIQAVANCTVPKISIVIGGSFGAGNYAMCGRGLDPRFIFAWPNNRTAVMGGAQAGQVLRIVTEQKFKRKQQNADPKMLDQLESSTREHLDKQSTALYGTAHLWDDGLIDPRETRALLGFLLSTCDEAAHRTLRANTFGVARL